MEDVHPSSNFFLLNSLFGPFTFAAAMESLIIKLNCANTIIAHIAIKPFTLSYLTSRAVTRSKINLAFNDLQISYWPQHFSFQEQPVVVANATHMPRRNLALSHCFLEAIMDIILVAYHFANLILHYSYLQQNLLEYVGLWVAFGLLDSYSSPHSS